MSGFGLTAIKEQGDSFVFDAGCLMPNEQCVPTTWFEFPVENNRIQEVVGHLKLIGMDVDPRVSF